MTNATQVRSAIVDFLRRELIGPDPRPEHQQLNNGDELLRPQDPPRLRYSAGVLFPRKACVSDQENASIDEVAGAESGPAEGDEPENSTPSGTAGDADSTTEHEVNRANEYLPSAMGLTALVHLPKRLRVVVHAAHYEKKTVTGVGRQDNEGNWFPHHYRKAINPPPVEIDCLQLASPRHVTRTIDLQTGNPDLKLAIHIYSRPYARATEASLNRIVTFTLINQTMMSGDRPKDDECLFQCEFKVEDTDGAACFLEYPEREGLEDDAEEQSLRLLYRHHKTFAVGHGCAAEWPDTDVDAVREIGTNTLPTYEIKPILPREIEGLDLSMGLFSDRNNASALEKCQLLAEGYLHWIAEQEITINAKEFPKEHWPTATRHLELCRACYKRITAGIDLLSKNEKVRQAFSWMNRAMLEQQLHYDLASNHRRSWVARAGALSLESTYTPPNLDEPPPGKGKWRPFQLVFILMNLHAMSRRDASERRIVDLIWFPTGGGKTEAYLGLTAFTIFYRRLLDLNDAGTTVLMRYTLRLLTTQQFQRAASLICACEVIRREHQAELGTVPVSIGLWVGQGVTPNKNADAVKALNVLHRNGKPNPFVLLTCPWCGAEMGPVQQRNAYFPKGYRKEGKRVVFRCEDSNCDFHDSRGLPLLVVDEAIYDARPTLVIGTVDKFAMLPWNPDARRLFGLGDHAAISPPDLIIQDELHLISGALGSMVGMYESTIGELCQHDWHGEKFPAKIVASTATICRAAQQANSLYACGEKNVFLFPPQGLRAGDSYFAEETSHDREGNRLPGRLYLGFFGSALSSHVTAQVRVISALLQAVRCVPTPSLELLDAYWTLMVYFNSLRELGHAATLIRADIREHLNAVWDRLDIRRPAAGSNNPDLRRFINRDLELTSRIQSTEVTDVLQQLFNSYPGTVERRPVDVCLATNMIQVGLDVPRLGLMAVIGQPKTTSEYIQATSRVGRDTKGPGLVIAVYNPAKPRDRSHFEHFRSYHQSIYRWVEPTSVTPFAVPVRERALHAQLITLARYWGNSALRERPSPPPNAALVDRILNALIKRIDIVDAEESTFARQMIMNLVERWVNVAPPIYGHFGSPPQETPLMYPSGSEPRALWSNRAKATPSSMRNVDSGCNAGIIHQFLEP